MAEVRLTEEKFDQLIERIGNNDPEIKSLKCRLCDKDSANYQLSELEFNRFQQLFFALARNTVVEELDFAARNIKGQVAGLLRDFLSGNGNTTVKKLILSHNCFLTREEALIIAQGLTENNTIKTLIMSDCPIGDDGAVAMAQALRENTTLTELILSGNKIGDVGAVAMAQALIRNTTLAKLSLSSNKIEDDGATKLIEALEENTTLRDLDLKANRISDANLFAINQHFEDLTKYEPNLGALAFILTTPIDQEKANWQQCCQLQIEALERLNEILTQNPDRRKTQFTKPEFSSFLKEVFENMSSDTFLGPETEDFRVLLKNSFDNPHSQGDLEILQSAITTFFGSIAKTAEERKSDVHEEKSVPSDPKSKEGNGVFEEKKSDPASAFRPRSGDEGDEAAKALIQEDGNTKCCGIS